MASESSDGDEDFRRAFGAHTCIPKETREYINRIKGSDPALKDFQLGPDDTDFFPDQAWELLGRYIASCDHLEGINFEGTGLMDENTPLLFEHLTGSKSLKRIDLNDNDIGLDGIRSMVPFLKNSSLAKLRMGWSDGINTECLRLVIDALHDGSIQELDFLHCSIEDIAALSDYSLPHLKKLDLADNKIQSIPSLEKYTNLEDLWLHHNRIGGEGCRSIAKLLQNQSSKLRCLHLDSNDIGDEEVKILANSLKHNATLMSLSLVGNEISVVGLRAFLNLLNDASSIESSYNSNHTLRRLLLSASSDSNWAAMKEHIYWAIGVNNKYAQDVRQEGNHEGAGRAKVVETQMDSTKRMELCRLQGIHYSFSSIFAGVETVFLPNILALAAKNHDQNELYRLLVVAAPDLVSLIDKTYMLKEIISRNTARMTALAAEYQTLMDENINMKRQLNPIDSGGRDQSLVGVESIGRARISGKKRRRSSSF